MAFALHDALPQIDQIPLRDHVVVVFMIFVVGP